MQHEHQKGSLKDTFHSFGAAPKAGAWEAITASLDNKKQKRRAIIWWWSTGLAAVLVIGSLTWLLFPASSSEQQQQLAANRKPSATTDTIFAAKKTRSKQSTHRYMPTASTKTTAAHNDLSSDSRTHSLPESIPALPSTNPLFIGSTPTTPPVTDSDNANRLTTTTFSGVSDSVTIDTPVASTTTSPSDSAVVDSSPNAEDNLLANTIRVTRLPRWRFTVGRDWAKTRPESDPLTYPVYTEPSFQNADAFSTYPNYDPVPFMEQSQGVQLAIARSLGVKRRWWIESGFQYATFQSAKNVAIPIEKKGNITHYSVGVPVTVNYTFLQNHRITLGVSVGVLNQFFYKTYQEITANNLMSISAEGPDPMAPYTFKERFHLYAGQVGLDVGFNLSQRWSIIAQPQFRYYLGTTSDSQWSNTFRRGWIGGTFGLRYTLLR